MVIVVPAFAPHEHAKQRIVRARVRRIVGSVAKQWRMADCVNHAACVPQDGGRSQVEDRRPLPSNRREQAHQDRQVKLVIVAMEKLLKRSHFRLDVFEVTEAIEY